MTVDVVSAEHENRLVLTQRTYPHRALVVSTHRILSNRPPYLTACQRLGCLYDATAAYRAKKDMPTLDVASLAAGDVVLAECYIMRSPRGAGGVDHDGADRLHSWLEIQSVSLLAGRPVESHVVNADVSPFTF